MSMLDVIENQNIISTSIPDLVFRNFSGEQDFPKIMAVIQDVARADQLECSDTVEDLARSYRHLTHCDPFQDALLVEIGGKCIGYGRVWWMLAADGSWLGGVDGFLLPAWRGHGIGRAMLCMAEARLQEISDALVISGELGESTPRVYDQWVFDTEVEKTALLEAAGYQVARVGQTMVRPDLERLPDASLPAGVEVRPVQPGHVRAIWDASQEAFRDHWGYVPPSEQEYQGWLESPEFDPSLWQVAWDGDQVAGSVLTFINSQENREYNRKRGYTEGISVRRPWRQQGLARALLVRALHAIKARGMQEAALSVDSQNLNGAFRLYESLGFSLVKRLICYRKPIMR